MSSYFPHMNPFNVLASLIAHLKKVDPQLYQDKSSRSASKHVNKWDRETDKLCQSFPEFRSSNVLLRNGISLEAAKTLRVWCEKHNSFFPILSLICRLDRTLYWESILRSSYLRIHLKNMFQSLNDNAMEVGISIVPRVPSLNDPISPADDENAVSKTWAFDWEEGINQELGNTYYIETENLKDSYKGYTVHHIVVNNWPVKETLRVAASPLSQGKLLMPPVTYTTADNLRCFSIEGLQNPHRIRSRLQVAYLCAAKHNAEILLFPEMLGDSSIMQSSKELDTFLAQLQKSAEDHGYPSPSLLLLPTWWHDGRNELYVINAFGECICIQQKQYPFVYMKNGQKYREDLSHTKPDIYVLHIPKLGRVTFPICKDYLTTSYRTLLTKVLRSTLLLCPSYSSSKFSFALTVPTDLQYGCYTAWINTCAAASPSRNDTQPAVRETLLRQRCAKPEPEYIPPSYVGLMAGPTSPEQPLVHLFRPNCKGDCGMDDGLCLFLAEIRRTGAAPEISVKDHLWSDAI